MQSMPDGSFKFICHYSDHGIKFGAAGALIQKTCRAVALFLFDLFTLIGPPKTLQSENGREFSNVALEGKAQKVYLDEEVCRLEFCCDFFYCSYSNLLE